MKRMLFCSSLFLLFFASVAFVNPVEKAPEIVLEEDFKCQCQGTISISSAVCDIPTGDFSVRINQPGRTPIILNSVGNHTVTMLAPLGFSISAVSECPSSLDVSYNLCGAQGTHQFVFPFIPSGTIVGPFGTTSCN